jgi:hypothetical protein
VLIPECAVSHVTLMLASCVMYSAWNPKDNYDMTCEFFVVQFNGLQKLHIPASFNMYLVINKCATPVKTSNFSGHYLRNLSTLDIGVLGYINILSHTERPPEVLHIPPGTFCIRDVV